MTQQDKKYIILDASRFTTVQSCARLGNFTYDMDLEPIHGKSKSLEMGSIVHKIQEVFYQNQINGFNRATSIGMGMTAGELYIRGCPDCSDFIPTIAQYVENEKNEILKPKCGHTINEYPGIMNTDPDDAQWALDTSMQYFEFYKNDHWIPLESEKVRGKILYEDDEVIILWKAKIDVVVDTNEGIYSVDHKTMKQNRSTISLNNQFIGQCLVMEKRTVIINKIGFQKTLKPVDKFKREPISYSADALLEWQEEILPYYCKMMLLHAESGYYPPNYTHCENKFGRCGFIDVCAANRNMREMELKLAFRVGEKWDPI